MIADVAKALVLGLLSFVRDILADRRAADAERELGASNERARQAAAVADAERRGAAVPDQSVVDTIRDFEEGKV